MAQRLVRKICQHCIYSYNLTSEATKELKKQFDMEKILKMFEEQGVIISSKKQSFESLLFFKGKGCKQCGDTGYKGRVAIYEVLEITPQIADLILRRAATDEIRAKAIQESMLTMPQDGFIKAKNGITTIEEILRVTRE
jgi:type IV pilus assembly protein PilB